MGDHPLKVVAASTEKATPAPSSLRGARAELQARMERLWLTDPVQFDPNRNAIERERLARTAAAIATVLGEKGPAVDLGCGYGDISRAMRDSGWRVDSVDIASNALKAFESKDAKGINLIQDALPSTKLADDGYQLVVCTEVIGYLEPREYRLLMAELSRLVKREGWVVCSTPIDIDSDDALQRFGELAETEFQIVTWIFSHHLLQLKLKRFFEAPSTFVAASNSSELRRRGLEARSSIFRWLYSLNTSLAGGYFWLPFSWVCSPIVHVLKQSRALMVLLEGICRFFWDTAGISHALFIGRRRLLIAPTRADLESVEPKGKRQVWE